MRKIIDGKVYDTNTAKVICYITFRNRGDLEFFEETIYRTRKGQWFFFGEGGPMSKYAKNIGGNTMSGSQEIQLMTEEQAKNWIEKNADAQTYLDNFGADEG